MAVYYVNEFYSGDTVIHKADCPYYTDDHVQAAMESGAGRRLGPYYHIKDAAEAAFCIGRPIRKCTQNHCWPQLEQPQAD